MTGSFRIAAKPVAAAPTQEAGTGTGEKRIASALWLRQIDLAEDA